MIFNVFFFRYQLDDVIVHKKFRAFITTGRSFNLKQKKKTINEKLLIKQTSTSKLRTHIQQPNRLLDSLASTPKICFPDFNKKLSFSKSVIVPNVTIVNHVNEVISNLIQYGVRNDI